MKGFSENCSLHVHVVVNHMIKVYNLDFNHTFESISLVFF